jgi:hypothetical protein
LGLLCDVEGYTFTWKPNTVPLLIKGNFSIACQPDHNVPFVVPGVMHKAAPSSESASSSSDPQGGLKKEGENKAEEVDVDDEMPELQFSSDDEDFTPVVNKKKNKNKKAKDGNSSSSSPAAARGDSEPTSKRKPRSSG